MILGGTWPQKNRRRIELRIGQKHSVKIYKMVTEDSIEERIIALQQKKAELADIILQMIRLLMQQ